MTILVVDDDTLVLGVFESMLKSQGHEILAATDPETAMIDPTGSRFGHLMEAQFPLGLALAALAIAKGELFPPSDTTGLEIAKAASPSQIVVVGTGHWRGEGMALVEAAD